MHDGDRYPDPHRFWPERFELTGKTEEGPLDPRRLTFGLGRRSVPPYISLDQL
jgi:hypothetical protein